MSNYCPIWVLKCIVAQVCFDFLEQGGGLNIISKKYLSGLNELYLDKDLPKIDDMATDYLKICVDLNINEKSIDLISDYLFFKFYYVNSVLKRKYNSFFADITFSKYPRYPNDEEVVKSFFKFSTNWLTNKKTIYQKGWNLRVQDEFEQLKALANKPFSEEIIKMIDLDKKQDEFNSTWIK